MSSDDSDELSKKELFSKLGREHIEKLNLGVNAWNQWRKENPLIDRPVLDNADLREKQRGSLSELLGGMELGGATEPGRSLEGINLSGAFLINAIGSGAILRDADLSNTFFNNADLWQANLNNVNASKADLQGTKLDDARLRDSNFTHSNLGGATLINTDLTRANLTSSNLCQCTLSNTIVNEADFTNAEIGWSIIANTDLSQAYGLETVRHKAASTIGIDTMVKTAAGLSKSPERKQDILWFFDCAKVPDKFLVVFDGLININASHSCFISYSVEDKDFAKKLYSSLMEIGVTCWFDEVDIESHQDHITNVLYKAIEHNEKVLLCCSSTSLSSNWVDEELGFATARERDGKKVVVPLYLDHYVFEGWQSRHKEAIIDRRGIDFREWKSDKEYSMRLNELLSLLRH